MPNHIWNRIIEWAILLCMSWFIIDGKSQKLHMAKNNFK